MFKFYYKYKYMIKNLMKILYFRKYLYIKIEISNYKIKIINYKL